MHVYQGLRFRAGSKVYRGRIEDGPRTLCPGKVISGFLLFVTQSVMSNFLSL